ncbi:MAG: sulfite exporter TauE/SafE family protein [Thermoplasmata archaeon]|nr:sulfite exporter TauE/SafE family protein [Thermoplasmata archaeon]
METWIIIIAIIMLFFAGLVQGLAGFGFSMVSIPILIIIIEPQLLTPTIIIHSVIINIFLFIKVRKDVQLGRIWPLVLAAIAGIPIGTWLLTTVDSDILRLFVGLFIMLIGLAYIKNFRIEIKNERLAFLPVGFISGILNGSITLSGPPVVLTLTNQGVEKKTFRANMIAYFMLLNLATLPFHFARGLFTDVCINLSFMLLPGMILGAFIGTMLVKKVDEKNFKKMVLVMVTVSGLISMTTGILTILL